MADKLTTKLDVTYTPDTSGSGSVQTLPQQTDTITMTGTDFISGTWNVAVTDDTLNIEDLSSLGYCFFKNLDAANYVEFSSDAAPTNYALRLNAGEWCWHRWGQANTVITGKANTGIVKVEFRIYEA